MISVNLDDIKNHSNGFFKKTVFFVHHNRSVIIAAVKMYLNVYRAYRHHWNDCVFKDFLSQQLVRIPTAILIAIPDRDIRDASCIVSVKALEHNRVSINLSQHDAINLAKVVVDYALLFRNLFDVQMITNILGVGYGLNKMIS